MAEFRSTTSEFKETWQREVNFEEEVKAFRSDDDEAEPSRVASDSSLTHREPNDEIAAPAIKADRSGKFQP